VNLGGVWRREAFTRSIEAIGLWQVWISVAGRHCKSKQQQQQQRGDFVLVWTIDN
jgi:hypothetical protein